MSTAPIVTVRITGLAREQIAPIEYSLAELSLRMGLHLDVDTSGNGIPDLVYGDPVPGFGGPTVPFHSECYSAQADFVAKGEPPRWMPASRAEGAPVDLVGGAFRLLALLDEARIQERDRDRRGVFTMRALPEGRRAAAVQPLVEHHAEALRSLIETSVEVPPARPAWPGGKRWAVLLTHDTDAVRLSSGAEILFNAGKAIRRRDGVRARMAREGLRRRGSSIVEDPLFGFPGWRDSTDSLGVRSAFYLYVRRKVGADLNDCRSTVADPGMDWTLLREMADGGWEFGLHAPIKAKSDIDEFILGKRFIEERLGRSIRGLRHHYWALDWRSPHLTYRKHVNAGFRYDLSMAYRDSAGFRTGTCFPHRPWDPGRKRGLDMISIPTAIMDGHLIKDGVDAQGAVSSGVAVLETIRRAGGVATLDWHTEAALNDLDYRGHRSVAESLLDWVIESGDAWVTTPWELVRYWHERRRSLLPFGEVG